MSVYLDDLADALRMGHVERRVNGDGLRKRQGFPR